MWELYDLRTITPADATVTDALLHQPFVAVDYNEVTPRETSMTDSWWWMRKEGANFAITPSSADHPFQAVSGAVQAPECGPIPVTVRLTAGGQVAEETVVARPGTPTDFALRLDRPESGTSTLTVTAEGQGCPVEPGSAGSGGGERRFARVLNLTPS